jgi:hypothetical protein
VGKGLCRHFQAHNHRAGAAIRVDDQAPFHALIAGTNAFDRNPQGNRCSRDALKQLLSGATSVAFSQNEPARIRGNGAIKQTHASIGHSQLEALVNICPNYAQVELVGGYLKRWRLKHMAWHTGEKLVKASFFVGETCSSASRKGQVDPTQLGQEFLDAAALEHVGGSGPIILTGQGHLIEVPTLPTRRHHQGFWKALQSRGLVDCPIGGKWMAVVIAE